MGEHLDKLIGYLHAEHPQFTAGLDAAAAAGEGRFESMAETFCRWAAGVLGDKAMDRVGKAFVRLTYDINMAQARYEARGQYASRSFADVQASHYDRPETMDEYLWGAYASNFLWAHHVQLSLHYHDRFLTRLPAASHIIEIAPGPGGWGLYALEKVADATLRGYDISESSVRIATAMANAAGMDGRARYEQRNALSLGELEAASADAVISCFLLEHLEQPPKVFDVVRHLLRPGGCAYVTAALTAAQVDHIYEFQHESELVVMAEQAGLRVAELFSTHPQRLLPKARFVPRSASMVLEPTRLRTHEG